MRPDIVAAIDSINVTLNQGGMETINIVLAFVMFGVALGINPSIFKEVFTKPKSVIVGSCCQLILLPLFTFLLTLALGNSITWSMAMGMILVASCPGGNISNFMTSLSKGNIELSVSLSAISTALAVVCTPFNFWLYGNLYLKISGLTAEVPQLVIPIWDIFKTIFILLGIPLTAGILTKKYLPKVADFLHKPMQMLSIVFFIGMVVLAFAGNFDAFMRSIRYIFLVVMIHNLVALATGFSAATIFKLPRRDRRTLTIETGIQNSGLGLVLMLGTVCFECLKISLDPATGTMHIPGGMLVITAWWGVWHIISGLTVSFIFNRSKKEL